MKMRIDSIEPGQRFSLEGLDEKTNERVVVPFTVLAGSWFPSPSPEHRGTFYRGAMVLADDGRCAIIDFLLIEFCQPLLCLPAPSH